MVPIDEDVARYLAEQGVGTLGGDGSDGEWCVSAAEEPPEPSSAVTVYMTGGAGPDTDELDLLNVTFQVRVRAHAVADAHEKQEEIRDLLILPTRISTGRSVFVGVFMQSDVAVIGRDDKNRYLLTANYRAIRERA